MKQMQAYRRVQLPSPMAISNIININQCNIIAYVSCLMLELQSNYILRYDMIWYDMPLLKLS